MTNTKMTKTQMFEETISALRMLEGTEDLIAFHEKQIAQLEAKAAKAKETAAKKRAENDKLCVSVVQRLALVQMPQGRPCRMPAEWVALAAPQE